MPSPADERLLGWLCRIYGLMLLAYPSGFRREYRREMVVLFRTLAQRVMRDQGHRALAPFLLHVSWDWFTTALRENATMTTILPALRWFVALPVALLAAVAAPRLVFVLARPDFHHVGPWIAVAFLVMAAAFVRVGVWAAPGRKDAVARIALSVVSFWGVACLGLGALGLSRTPMIWGSCLLLGGVAGYLPRHREKDRAAAADDLR